MEKIIPPVIDQTLFDLKLNEAQFYSEQGLYDEADKIYVKLINELKQLPQTKSSSVQIRQLEEIRQEYQIEIKQVQLNILSDIDTLSGENQLFNKALQSEADPNLCTKSHGTKDVDQNHTNQEFSNNQIESDLDGQVSAFISEMIIEAFNKNASYIYIEPDTNSNNIYANFIDRDKSKQKNIPRHKSINSNIARIRFRIDGVCKLYIHIPNTFALNVIFKIKVMANMNIKMKGMPLYGKIRFKSEETGAMEIQVIVVPISGSKEDVVLKFFPIVRSMDLQSIGFLQHNLKLFSEIINKPSGLIIVSGLSDSGKTTTLHSALKLINTPEKKIWYAEYPIEITQKALSKTEVHQPLKSLDYHDLLKVFIKAGSDVIMLEEMIDFEEVSRNYETTSLAIRASLKGNLIFVGVNASSASDSIRKVLEVGINSVHFADSLLCILNQRLVGRLCKKCRKPLITTHDNSSDNILDVVIGEFWKSEDYLVSNCANDKDEILQLNNNIDKNNITIYTHSSEGCEECSYTGYKGRIAVHELLINNNAMKSLIKDTSIIEFNLTQKTEEISKNRKSQFEKIDYAVKKLKRNLFNYGCYTLKQDGILKVIEGITDMSELRRNNIL